MDSFRQTSQDCLPISIPDNSEGYSIYPAFKLPENQLLQGYESISKLIAEHSTVVIDGYGGVLFDYFRDRVETLLFKYGIQSKWHDVSKAYKSPDLIDEMIRPFMGGNDPLFGKRTSLELQNFFEPNLLKAVEKVENECRTVFYGTGAALNGYDGLLIYLDIPKNEIQFRSRAGSIKNLGALRPFDPKAMYKRFYFVDWVVLNKHKEKLLPVIDYYIDTQRTECPIAISGQLLRDSLHSMSENVFRVRPWFEPGAWGGTWIKQHINGLNKSVPNYAWSFELISPENGLLFESSGTLFEASFDCLMYLNAESVLGESYATFGTDFPIRFDFLDTFDGGNLSIQCHPLPEYMKTQFGENYTQEETYYILDNKENAEVYLGFQDDINPDEFQLEIENSFKKSSPVSIERFVQKHIAAKHDLFLIPSGTIHGSGKNNLVLEISSTPYIFTFKMYDWLRLDLDGKPRTLNIGRGMENLDFYRKGNYVKNSLIAKPILIEEGSGWKLFSLNTHETQFYNVERYHFSQSVEIKTNNKFHVLSLVEGTRIRVETGNGQEHYFNYAETFVIPAAAGSYHVTNCSEGEAMLIKAFVK